ncbi:hypothetical protein [Cerasicoccus frondis]|uniref:hypothetical protein n=1 Tax=Cerasicoccus frondis TaxID=490090 RepID=UPI002852AA21|nr:hypothetical protein [Cerasicoccus frondis]
MKKTTKKQHNDTLDLGDESEVDLPEDGMDFEQATEASAEKFFTLPQLELTVKKVHFEALAYFVSKVAEDFRKGIIIVVEQYSFKMIVCTGKVMAIIHVPCEEANSPCRFWIDGTAMSGLEPLNSQGDLTLKKIEDEPGLFPLPRVEVHGNNASIVANANEVNFDFHNLIPSTTREAMSHFMGGVALVDAFVKAAKKLKGTSLRMMQHMGESEAMTVKIEGVPQFYGVLMPVKAEPLEEDRPSWL